MLPMKVPRKSKLRAVGIAMQDEPNKPKEERRRMFLIRFFIGGARFV
jgi:hypothetical protein